MSALPDRRARAFLAAQDRVWAEVRRELAAGRKTSHWIWFVFPQLASLGRSERAKFYGIADFAEAEAYLAHPTLRARLVEASGLMLDHAGADPAAILGGIDAAKLRSSMTLFAAVPGAPDVFARVLEAFYGGVPCPRSEAEIST